MNSKFVLTALALLISSSAIAASKYEYRVYIDGMRAPVEAPDLGDSDLDSGDEDTSGSGTQTIIVDSSGITMIAPQDITKKEALIKYYPKNNSNLNIIPPVRSYTKVEVYPSDSSKSVIEASLDGGSSAIDKIDLSLFTGGSDGYCIGINYRGYLIVRDNTYYEDKEVSVTINLMDVDPGNYASMLVNNKATNGSTLSNCNKPVKPVKPVEPETEPEPVEKVPEYSENAFDLAGYVNVVANISNIKLPGAYELLFDTGNYSNGSNAWVNPDNYSDIVLIADGNGNGKVSLASALYYESEDYGSHIKRDGINFTIVMPSEITKLSQDAKFEINGYNPYIDTVTLYSNNSGITHIKDSTNTLSGGYEIKGGTSAQYLEEHGKSLVVKGGINVGRILDGPEDIFGPTPNQIIPTASEFWSSIKGFSF